jgi:hypothetical protein
MSPTLGVIIMMNNYFHDVATALLVASGVTMWVIVRKYGNNSQGETTDYFLGIYRSITRLARFSLAWIILGGIPRTIFYKDFEWANAVGKDQVPALIIKHILAFTLVGTGAYVWLKISKRVKAIKGNKTA